MTETSLNLRQMEVFRAIMVTGTIASAAEVLHVSQPSVSKMLALAERQNGLKLFERAKGRLVPTAAGRLLYEEIDRLWAGVERVRKLSSELKHPSEGTLSVAASSSLGSSVVPAAMADLMRRFPKLQAKVELLVPRMLEQALVDHSVDVGVAMFEVEHPNLTVVSRHSCGWVCIMPIGHPLAVREAIRPDDLRGYRLISFPHEASYGVDAHSLFGPVLADLDFALEVRAGQSACLFSIAGAGIAIVDEATVHQNVFPQLVVKPFVTDSRLTICVVRNLFKPLTAFNESFCELLSQHLSA